MTRRTLLVVAIIGHPLVFGVYFCLSGLFTQGSLRFITSLLAEFGALAIGVAAVVGALRSLRAHQFSGPTRADEALVHAVSLLYLLIIAVTAANAGSLGLLASGSRLDFYFENDWYRRIVTFSFIPSAVATFVSMHALLSPRYSGRRTAFIANLALLFAMSLLGGSKGAAVLAVTAALGFVFTTKRMPVAWIAATLAAVSIAYVALFLLFSSEREVTLLNIALRFYMSIDMSLVLTNPATSEILTSKLGGVWTEIFRSLSALGVRVSDLPIGTLIYQQISGGTANLGSNCRFGSLLLVYPDRIDFLVGYPLAVLATTYLLREILNFAGMRRAATVAAPFFIFQSFQDVYWWASHVVPLIVFFALARAVRAIAHEAVDRPSHAA